MIEVWHSLPVTREERGEGGRERGPGERGEEREREEGERGGGREGRERTV